MKISVVFCFLRNNQIYLNVKYLEKAAPTIVFSSHLPDVLNTSIRDLPRSPDAPVIKTEHAEAEEMCVFAIIIGIRVDLIEL